MSPRLVGGDAKRIVAGAGLPVIADLALRSVCEEDGYLFLRYRAASGSSAPGSSGD